MYVGASLDAPGGGVKNATYPSVYDGYRQRHGRARESCTVHKHIGGTNKERHKIISCSHDGISVKQQTQALIIEHYRSSAIRYNIKHPVGGKIGVEVVSVAGQPLVMVQERCDAWRCLCNALERVGNFVLS